MFRYTYFHNCPAELTKNAFFHPSSFQMSDHDQQRNSSIYTIAHIGYMHFVDLWPRQNLPNFSKFEEIIGIRIKLLCEHKNNKTTHWTHLQYMCAMHIHIACTAHENHS